MLKRLRLVLGSIILAVIIPLAPQSAVAMAPVAPQTATNQSQGSISITSTSVQPSFPLTIKFNIVALGTSNIVDARLHYRIERTSFAQVTSEAIAKITPSKSINSSYTLDLRYIGGVPTGTKIVYWWTLKDTDNNVTQSATASFSFEDTKYAWQSITQGLVTLKWYQGNNQFAQTLMTTAQQALVKLAADTGAQLKKPVTIYIYNGSADLQGAMVFPREWTGGVAFTDFNIITIGVSTDNLAWGTGAVIHELTHLVTNQMTNNPYSGIPVWLNEGLSMYAEGPLDSTFVTVFSLAVLSKSLISVRTLDSPFSADSTKAYISYAESYYLVKFLVDRYGQSKLSSLLTTFAQGSTYDNAFKTVYGFDIAGLNTLWQNSVYGK
ncbi:peptidase MA family metallohydrolase [Dehalogenimonas etheniformans]|uniref:Peptidase MA domain-containing protein n=1 Tax=Dehalogenimonas etheniformans TaxID=1536648 RepID=A0A2P5P8Z9_9CHLR|nr:peptidase MA family metallohydrolase [Dehalogenimonas etheniformans]PPD58773.1 peptidase MA domain-containing protein [Dehalogenimonas etheniformans]QNT76455.1 peptidase MA domain-containing protein [Dehalogenimonas etheniformans]